MPLEYVGGASVTSGGVTGPMTLSLTALTGGIGSSAQVGDLVIVATGNIGGADNDPGVNSAGYTELVELYADAVRDANLAVAYKRLTTAETSISLTGTGVASNAAGAVVHVWRGADPTTPMDVAVQSATGINSRGVNPPATTPVTTGAVIIAAGILTGTAQMNSTQLSSGYGNPVYITYDPGGAIGLGIASKEWAGGTEDPAMWTGTGGTTGDSWAAVTLAIRPASAGVTIDRTATAASASTAAAARAILRARTSSVAAASSAVASGTVIRNRATAVASASTVTAEWTPPVSGIEDIPGLLWSTGTSIEYNTSGAVVPPISLARASDTPVYCIISVDTVTGHDGAIFSLSNPGTSRWVAQGFTLQRMWQTEAWIEVSGTGTGQLKRLFLPAAPSSHVWEAWSGPDGAVWNETGVAVPQFTNPDMRSPDATTELYIGYVPNNGDPALRGAGTINRMALFSQIPISTDRARLGAWVVGTSSGQTVERTSTVASSSIVTATASNQRSRNATVAAGSVVTAERSAQRGRGATVTAGSSVAATRGILRWRSASVSSASAVTAAASVRRGRQAAVAATSAVSAQVTGSQARFATVQAASAASAISTITRSRAVTVTGASTAAAQGTVTHPRSAPVQSATSVIASSKVVRSRAATVASASSVTATPTISGVTEASASVSGTSSAAVSRTIIRRRGAGVSASATVTTARSIRRNRIATVSAASSMSAGSGQLRNSSSIVTAASSAIAMARRILSRGAVVSASGQVTAAANTTRQRGAVVIAASGVTAERLAIVVRFANVTSASTVTAVAFIGVLAVRFAYPGEARGGRLIHDARDGALLFAPHTGTLLRG